MLLWTCLAQPYMGRREIPVRQVPVCRVYDLHAIRARGHAECAPDHADHEINAGRRELMGERIEWEAIARRKHQIARVTRGGLASTAEERELEYIAALEAGERLAAAADRALGCCEFDDCEANGALEAARADWRRCVAPRGEGA